MTRPDSTTRRSWPTGTPMENYPIEDEAPTVPEPTAKVRSKYDELVETRT